MVIDSESIAKAAFALPHLAAYIILTTLVAYGSLQLTVCYVFSTLGCYVGGILDNGSISGPLLNNLVASSVAFAVVTKCSAAAGLCKGPVVSEFVNSLCGAR